MYVLLDVDGVLNKKSQWNRSGALDKICLDNFALAFSGLSVKIILISSWRYGFISRGNPNNSPQIKNLEKQLEERGLFLTGTIQYDSSRNKAVRDFIKVHPDTLVLDDDASEYIGKLNNLYLIDYKSGFTDKNAKEIRRKWLS